MQKIFKFNGLFVNILVLSKGYFCMDFIWQQPNVGIGNIVFEIILMTLLYAFVLLIFIMVIKRQIAFWFLIVSYVLAILSYLFCLNTSLIAILCITSAIITVIMFANLGDFRHFIANPFKRTAVKLNRKKVERIFDRHATYQIIESTVKALSKAKIGALMTFEKSTSLTEFCKNGVSVNAPISQELLMTIFYPGTRLHDGAVIIKGNIIYAAAVMYKDVSTATLDGKYGTRHRAALGIAERTDAIALVVSEETSRISIAMNGELIYNLSLDEVRIRLLEALAPSHKILNEAKEGGMNE